MKKYHLKKIIFVFLGCFFHSLFAQELKEKPYQTDSLLAANKVSFVKEETFNYLLKDMKMNIVCFKRLNEKGLPIKSKSISYVNNEKILLFSIEKYVFENNKIKGFNEFGDKGFKGYKDYKINTTVDLTKNDWVFSDDKKTLKYKSRKYKFDEKNLLKEHELILSEKLALANNFEYGFNNYHPKPKLIKIIYVDKDFNIIKDTINAVTKSYYYEYDNKFNDGYIITKNKENQILSKVEYIDLDLMIKDGEHNTYYPNEKIKTEANYINDLMDGSRKLYYENGTIKREENYNFGKFLSGKCFDINGNEIPFFPFYKKPTYQNGTAEDFMADVKKQFIFPKDKSKLQTEELFIKLNLTIDENGKPINLKIIQGKSEPMNNELIRVINTLPNWKPAEVDGIPKSFNYNLSFDFDD